LQEALKGAKSMTEDTAKTPDGVMPPENPTKVLNRVMPPEDPAKVLNRVMPPEAAT
jgi:hypothetical protein